MLPAQLGCGLASLPCFLLTSSLTNVSRIPFYGPPTTGQSRPLCHKYKVIFCVPPNPHHQRRGREGLVVGDREGLRKYNFVKELPKKLVTLLRQCTLSVEVSGDEKYSRSCRQSFSLRNIPHFHFLPSRPHLLCGLRQRPNRRDAF